MEIRAVLDTNVVFAAESSPNPNSPNREELAAARTTKPGPRREIQLQTQLPLRHVHLAFDHVPLSAQSQGLIEESMGIHLGHPERPDHRLQVADQPSIRLFTT